jgi:uncharacterized membrane protein YgaE (UPF0421/DUF939 family)
MEDYRVQLPHHTTEMEQLIEQKMEHLLAEMKDLLTAGHEEIKAKLESLASRMDDHKAKTGANHEELMTIRKPFK